MSLASPSSAKHGGCVEFLPRGVAGQTGRKLLGMSQIKMKFSQKKVCMQPKRGVSIHHHPSLTFMPGERLASIRERATRYSRLVILPSRPSRPPFLALYFLIKVVCSQGSRAREVVVIFIFIGGREGRHLPPVILGYSFSAHVCPRDSSGAELR